MVLNRSMTQNVQTPKIAGRWWALLIPLVTAWPLVGVTPPIFYPLAFWVALVATVAVGWRSARATPEAVA